MSEVSEGSRELLISTSEVESGSVLVAVSDSGPGLPQPIPSESSKRSTRPSPAVWGWGWRSAARSSKRMAGDYGRRRTNLMALSFASGWGQSLPNSGCPRHVCFALDSDRDSRHPGSASFVPCVDGSGLARAFFTFCSIGRCSHVFGLLMRFT